MFRKLKEEYEKWGLNENTTKTEYLKIGNKMCIRDRAYTKRL